MSWLRKVGRLFGFGEGRVREWESVPYELREGVGLAVHDSPALLELEERLRKAVQGAGWLEHVKMRVFAKHPRMTDAEYDWLWLELRRFFLMTTVVRYVPMYSPKVDDIWHEMLLFSREYEAFCRSFAGRVIHHTPHVNAVPRQQAARDRAWFELLYGTMFSVQPNSERVLGRFRLRPIPADDLDWLRMSGTEEIYERLMAEPSGDAAVDRAAKDIAERIYEHGRRLDDYKMHGRKAVSSNVNDYAAAYAVSLLTFSVLQEEQRVHAGGDSGVVPYADSGDSGGGGGGGDGGGSSCGGSSCGGGCGGS
ncbi:hypothetical protein [Paenibacillus thermotolerans]|uniref:hypothetical protein n=1 Tax=Paenibacillus thermotolerans TaxID=3027807 RepID=UPI002367FE4A|nr:MULTISPECIES: hypothetical protein [unclassified Paenibacillus]